MPRAHTLDISAYDLAHIRGAYITCPTCIAASYVGKSRLFAYYFYRVQVHG